MYSGMTSEGCGSELLWLATTSQPQPDAPSYLPATTRAPRATFKLQHMITATASVAPRLEHQGNQSQHAEEHQRAAQDGQVEANLIHADL